MMQKNYMKFTRSIIRTFLFLIVLLPGKAEAQLEGNWSSIDQNTKRFVGIPQLAIRRSGPYVGLQSGKYYVPEFGYEMQWNRVKLKKPITHAGHMGFNYNFQRNVLGYDAGYWLKIGRLDLTYGANMVFRTDFDRNAFGVAPVVGFKFWQLHLQTGYHFLTKPAKDMKTNTFFVSLRFVFINNRDWNWKRKNKNG